MDVKPYYLVYLPTGHHYYHPDDYDIDEWLQCQDCEWERGYDGVDYWVRFSYKDDAIRFYKAFFTPLEELLEDFFKDDE